MIRSLEQLHKVQDKILLTEIVQEHLLKIRSMIPPGPERKQVNYQLQLGRSRLKLARAKLARLTQSVN